MVENYNLDMKRTFATSKINQKSIITNMRKIVSKVTPASASSKGPFMNHEYSRSATEREKDATRSINKEIDQTVTLRRKVKPQVRRVKIDTKPSKIPGNPSTNLELLPLCLQMAVLEKFTQK